MSRVSEEMLKVIDAGEWFNLGIEPNATNINFTWRRFFPCCHMGPTYSGDHNAVCECEKK